MNPDRTKPLCEHCWMEWGVLRAPQESDLAFLCAECYDTLFPYRRLADAINRGGRSGVL